MASLSTSRHWRATLAASAFIAGSLGPQLGAAQQQIPVPQWLSDTGKDLFTDVMNDEHPYSDATCEAREKLLKELAGHNEQGASQYRTAVLLDLGACEFKKEDYAKSALRYASAISEMNVPNEDALLQRQESASIPLMKQAAELLKKHELTEAAVALRRCRVVKERTLKSILKSVHKQMGQQGQAPPLEKIVEEIPGYGVTGQFLPTIVKQTSHMLRGELAQLEMLDNFVDGLDRKMATSVDSLKQSRSRLDKGKSAASTGVLLYVKCLPTEPIASGESLQSAQDLEKEVGKALVKEADSIDKPLTLVKRAKIGKDCKDDKGLAKTCEGLQKVPDVMSNGFGETRLLVVKAGKKQQLEACSTNANVGILLAAKDGVKLTVKGAESVELEAGKPTVVDFCLEASLTAKEQTPVLFAQAWHPEFAAVERTNELRLRSESFGLKEDDLKVATKVVNDNAKKSWEKSAKLWRKSSAVVETLRNAASGEAEAKKQAVEEAKEAQRKQEFDADEERKKGLEELERKRAEKRKHQEEVEAKKKRRQEILEQERAMRDPWLNAPEVKAVEAKLEDLKEQRRDANAKLEFDLSTSLTKEISAAERELKKVIKKARKEHKKAQKGGKPSEDKKGEENDSKDKKAPSELEDLQKQLQDVKEKKAAASEAEDFKEAKKLKDKQLELEAKIKKLEL